MKPSYVQTTNTRALQFLFISLLVVFGSLFNTTSAHAESADVIVERGLPELVKSMQLVVESVQERTTPSKDIRVLGASTENDAKIATLMALLQQLIAMYQGMLAEQQSVKVSDDLKYDPLLQKVSVNLKLGDQGTNPNSVSVYASIGGFATNKEISYWILYMKCSPDIVTMTGKGGLTFCGTTMRINNVDVYDVTQDYLALTTSATNNSNSKAEVILTLIAYNQNNVKIGNDKEILTLAPVTNSETPSITVVSPNGGESYISGESVISIKYKSSNIIGEKIIAYLYNPDTGNTRSMLGYAQESGELQMSLVKGDIPEKAGSYKITICAPDVQLPDWKDVCDSSDNYFKLVAPGTTGSIVDKITFTPDGSVGIDIYGKNLEIVEKIEYQANCCKPVEGTLIESSGSDTQLRFYPDSYLLKNVILGLSVRFVYKDGTKSDWYII